MKGNVFKKWIVWFMIFSMVITCSNSTWQISSVKAQESDSGYHFLKASGQPDMATIADQRYLMYGSTTICHPLWKESPLKEQTLLLLYPEWTVFYRKQAWTALKQSSISIAVMKILKILSTRLVTSLPRPPRSIRTEHIPLDIPGIPVSP